MPSRCRKTKCSRKCPRVSLIPRHCIDSLHIPCFNPHRCSPTCHNPFVHIHHHFGTCNAHCMASKCASCSDDSDSENETKEVPADVKVEVIQCPYSSSTTQATERPDNEDSPNETSYGKSCEHNIDTKLQDQNVQPETLPPGFTAHISEIGNERQSLMTCDRPGIICSKRLALNKKYDGTDQQLSCVEPLQGNSSAVMHPNHQLDSQYDKLNAQNNPGSCCTNIPCSTTKSIPDSKTAISQQTFHENQQSHVQQLTNQLSEQGSINQSLSRCINHNNLKTDTRNIPLDQVPSLTSTSSTQNLSDNPDVVQCCANAYSRHKPEVSPPLPTKGISSAFRPGFVIKKETTESSAEIIPAQCMTSISGCMHGIASIMPNIETTNIQTGIKSRPSTCSCKSGKSKSMKKKTIIKQEAGTNVCDSVECSANQNQDCPCRYPPGYSQFSCAGNITGNCKCSGQ